MTFSSLSGNDFELEAVEVKHEATDVDQDVAEELDQLLVPELGWSEGRGEEEPEVDPGGAGEAHGSLVVAALGCRSPTVFHISVSLSTNQVEIINFSTQYLPDSNLALMFSLFTTHIYYDRSYDKLFDQNIVKNIVVTFLAQLRVIVITE